MTVQILQPTDRFLIDNQNAQKHPSRTLEVAILNLMPTKITTETQILRLLSSSPIQINVTLTYTESHTMRNVSEEHIQNFYRPFKDIARQHFDGLIITGAPVEQMPFEAVDYWQELVDIFEWSKRNVFSTLHICWGAQAALYYHYGIPKYSLQSKMFGVFEHQVLNRGHKLVEDFDDSFYAPHSRHTEVRTEDILRTSKLELLAVSEEAGLYLAATRDGRQIFIPGHAEYDPFTLHEEYQRDLNKGLPIEKPKHYYPGDDPSQLPMVTWRGHANLLYKNWLQHFVFPAA